MLFLYVLNTLYYEKKLFLIGCPDNGDVAYMR